MYENFAYFVCFQPNSSQYLKEVRGSAFSHTNTTTSPSKNTAKAYHFHTQLRQSRFSGSYELAMTLQGVIAHSTVWGKKTASNYISRLIHNKVKLLTY